MVNKLLSENIFNTKKVYGQDTLFLGERPGLFDTVNKRFSRIWSLYKTQKSLDWDENEFNYSSCNAQFKTSKTASKMIKTLAWQWEQDSVAARTLLPIMAPFLSSSELQAAYGRVTDNEALHAATYSEIVRLSFDDPRVIIDEVMRVEEAQSRMVVVSKIFDDAYVASHRYALGDIPNDQALYNIVFMFCVAGLVMERGQFGASFAVTFAIADTGEFQPIGKAVQKIAQDELDIHAELAKEVLRIELTTERGQRAMRECLPLIKQLLLEVENSEVTWVDYLHEDDEELPGVTPSMLKDWSRFCLRDVYEFFEFAVPEHFPKSNPLKYMAKWLNIAATQASPQEQDNGQYKLGVLRRNDDNVIFDDNF